NASGLARTASRRWSIVWPGLSAWSASTISTSTHRHVETPHQTGRSGLWLTMHAPSERGRLFLFQTGLVDQCGPAAKLARQERGQRRRIHLPGEHGFGRKPRLNLRRADEVLYRAIELPHDVGRHVRRT